MLICVSEAMCVWAQKNAKVSTHMMEIGNDQQIDGHAPELCQSRGCRSKSLIILAHKKLASSHNVVNTSMTPPLCTARGSGDVHNDALNSAGMLFTRVLLAFF
jgi:hypothetical protein